MLMKDNVNKVIFAAGSGTTRAPMAMAIFLATPRKRQIDCEARGLVVNFPEPINPKVEAVLKTNGITIQDYSTKKLVAADFADNSVVITMDETQKRSIIEEFADANEENTYILNELVGDELEVIDPYGGTVQTYGLCFEVMKASIEKLMQILE